MTPIPLRTLVLPLGLLAVSGCGGKKTPAVAAATGTAQQAAVKVCGPDGQRAYLAQLACPGDDPVGQAERAGSLGPEADGHMVDHFQVTCPDGSAHELFLDLYHCVDPDPLQPIGELYLLPPPPPPEVVPWQPAANGIPLEAVARIPERGVLLEVTSTGAEPREVLRYHPEVGQMETVSMRMLMAMEMTIAGNSGGRMALPGMILEMEMEVTEVADHQIVYNAAVTEALLDRSDDGAGFPSDFLDELEASLKPLDGMRGYARITDRGESLESEFQLPPDAPPDLAQQMTSFSNSAENLAAPVPEEAVGLGATWSVYSLVDSSGFKIVQRADFVVVDLAGDTLGLDVSLVQQPLEANPQMDSLPPGAEMEMLSFASEGTGQSVTELSHLVPTGSLVTMNMDFAFAMLGEGQRIDAAMAMDMTMELQRAD